MGIISLGTCDNKTDAQLVLVITGVFFFCLHFVDVKGIRLINSNKLSAEDLCS